VKFNVNNFKNGTSWLLLPFGWQSMGFVVVTKKHRPKFHRIAEEKFNDS
jgi:hypothetical protein